MARLTAVLMALAALVLSMPLYAFMDHDTSYAAVRHIHSDEGTITMQVYHAPGKERMEFNAGGQTMTAILRLDRQLAWLVMPQMNAYMETSLARYASRTPQGYQVTEHKKVGTETINGYKAIKYRTRFRTEQGDTGSGYYWIVRDSIPIKMDLDVTSDGKTHHVVMELSDLKIASQDASLFEPPAGYSKMNIPGAGAAATTPSPSTQHPAAPEQPRQPNAAEEIGSAAADEAKNSTRDEVKKAVGGFIHGLFN